MLISHRPVYWYRSRQNCLPLFLNLISRCVKLTSLSLKAIFIEAASLSLHVRRILLCACNFFFDGLIAKMLTKTQSWENSFQSFGGRISLVKSIINSIPLYLLQTQMIQSTLRTKLRGSSPNSLSHKKKGLHLASWSKMSKPQVKGGLGFRTLSDSITCNTIKLCLKFRQQHSLWDIFMMKKYCNTQSTMEVEAKSGDSMCWRRMIAHRNTTETFIFWDIGEWKINFWNDHWMGDSSLADQLNLDTWGSTDMVADFWINNKWNSEKLKLMGCGSTRHILDIQFDSSGKDGLMVKGSSNNQTITKTFPPTWWQEEDDLSWGKAIWHLVFRPCMAFFNWRLMHSLLPIDNILKLKGLRLPSMCLCVWCVRRKKI